MLFTSLQFLLFFPVVAILYFFLPRQLQWGVLLAASCYFYMTFRPVYILIPAFTILIDYFSARAMERREGASRARFLALSLCGNLGALALFKYFNFFDQALTSLLAPVSLSNPIPFLKLAAPIGLSFHVFRSLSYTLEVYYGRYRAERHFGIFALYVLFFPELVAGPIERPKTLLPQLHKQHGFVYGDIVGGLQLALFGLFKKVVIADRLAPFVARVYDTPHGYSGISLVIATVCFALQLYCDFSGYTDIALGLGQALGLRLMKNFDRPYFSKSIAEFWRRWHISLSTWFRDYVYIPLAMTEAARRIESVAVVEAVVLILTFLASGLWHGAAWTYVFWGGLNGLYLALEFLLERPVGRLVPQAFVTRWNWPVRIVRVGFTFSLICFAAILFRARSLGDASYIMRRLTAGWGGLAHQLASPAFVKTNILLGQDKMEAIICGVSVMALLSIEWVQRTHSVRQILAGQRRWVRWTIYYAAIIALLFFGAFNKSQQFIYVQF
jgi:alginate O-acetyltransferase complex protein AlgI